MMKLTKKEVLNDYKCYAVGYCELQYLLHYRNATGYTAGIYGWNADIYLFYCDDIAIVTGFRPFGRGINPELTTKYEEKAMEIACDWKLNYKEKEIKINKLLKKFIEEVKGD